MRCSFFSLASCAGAQGTGARIGREADGTAFRFVFAHSSVSGAAFWAAQALRGPSGLPERNLCAIIPQFHGLRPLRRLRLGGYQADN